MGNFHNVRLYQMVVMRFRLEEPAKEKAFDLLRFLAITLAVALPVYYLPNYFLFEQLIAEHSAIVMGFVGIKSIIWYQGNSVFLNEFEIQRMCTGIQVIAVFLGIIVALPNTSIKKKALAFAIIAVSVYLANIGRIVLEIWLLYNGVLPWSLAHYPTGLILGIFAVAFLIVVADHFMPAIGDMAFSLLEGLWKSNASKQAPNR
jgi:exosortase/archaeosortase family protein